MGRPWSREALAGTAGGPGGENERDRRDQAREEHGTKASAFALLLQPLRGNARDWRATTVPFARKPSTIVAAAVGSSWRFDAAQRM
jgi:hypothetical protein